MPVTRANARMALIRNVTQQHHDTRSIAARASRLHSEISGPGNLWRFLAFRPLAQNSRFCRRARRRDELELAADGT